MRTPIFMTAGISRKVSVLRFIVMDGLAALISVPVWVYLGDYGASNREWLMKTVHQLQHGLFALIGIGAVILGWFWWRKRTRSRFFRQKIAEEWRQNMIEAAAEASEELMDKYLGGDELTEEEIVGALRQRTLAGEIQPMLCGSAFKNKGVQRMLDAVVELLPAPTDIPPVQGVNPNTEEADSRQASDEEKFSALAFKMLNDKYVGQLTFIRVYSGVVKSGDTVLNSVKGTRERIGRLVQMTAADRTEIEEVRAGDIAAAIGLKDVTTGETLCAESAPIILERMEFPEPVIHIAVEPKTKADQEKMGIALNRLAKEDPSFRVRTDGYSVRC